MKELLTDALLKAAHTVYNTHYGDHQGDSDPLKEAIEFVLDQLTIKKDKDMQETKMIGTQDINEYVAQEFSFQATLGRIGTGVVFVPLSAAHLRKVFANNNTTVEATIHDDVKLVTFTAGRAI